MRTSLKMTALALGVAGMVLAAAQPAASAPVATSTAALKAAAPDATIDVRYRRYRGYRHNWAGPAIAGAALGIIGAGIAASTWPRHGYYYDEPYYYAPRAYYADPYPYAYGYAPGWGSYYGRERFW